MRYEFHPEAEVDSIETILYYETVVPVIQAEIDAVRAARRARGRC